MSTTDRTSNSTVFDLVPPEKRAKIDRSIVTRCPTSYKEIFEEFGLADHGLAYHCFWRYARRLRERAELANLAELTAPEDKQLTHVLPNLAARRVFAALMH